MEYTELNDAPLGTLVQASIREMKSFILVLNTSTRSEDIGTKDDVYYKFDTISLRGPAIKWFVSRLNWFQSTAKLKYSIVNGLVIDVSDGSDFSRYEVEACIWIVATPDGKEWVEAWGWGVLFLVLLRNKIVIKASL